MKKYVLLFGALFVIIDAIALVISLVMGDDLFSIVVLIPGLYTVKLLAPTFYESGVGPDMLRLTTFGIVTFIELFIAGGIIGWLFYKLMNLFRRSSSVPVLDTAVKVPFSGMAITGFVLGLLSLPVSTMIPYRGSLIFIPVLALVLGVVSLIQVRKNQKRGKGLAIAGLIITSTSLAFYITLLN